MTDTRTPVVLVHGAWHAAWCWDSFKPYLEARGVAPIAPDLPGHGGNPIPMAEVSLARYADAIAEVLDGLDTPAILVGHSMAGAVVSEVAERRPDKIRTLVYVAAYLLPDGASVSQCMQEDSGNLVAAHVVRCEDGLSIGLAEEGLRDGIYTGIDEAMVAAALAKVEPQAIAPLVTPVHVTEDRFGRVPRAYVECTEDRTITIEMQRKMQQALPCDPVLTLDCGHFPALIEPDALADFIVELAR